MDKIKIKEIIKKYKFIKFIIVGGSSTLLDFTIYMILNNFIEISIAKFISMTISCIYSFFINRCWTFESKEKINSKQLLKYVITQIINILVNVGTNQLIYTITTIKLLAYIVATGVAMIINYLLQKTIVFKEKKA